MPKRNAESQPRGRHERPVVVLSRLPDTLLAEVARLTRDWNWDLRTTAHTNLEWPTDKPVAGALVTDPPTDPNVQRMLAEKRPVVRCGRLPYPDDKLLPTVLSDHAAQGRLAADHFAQRGFKHVTFVGYNPTDPAADAHELYLAFRERAEQHGMECHLKSLWADYQGAEVNRERQCIGILADWLPTLPRPVGLFTYADFMAERALRACGKAGLDVPEEVAVLGRGNSWLCEFCQMGLSSVDVAEAEGLKTALLLLHRLMNGGAAPTQPIMIAPRGIVVRQSTDVLAVADPRVARAMRFMWEHLDQDLSVDAIAHEVGVVRSTLERAFARALGRSVVAEMQRRRLAELCRLLHATNETVVDLAPQVGFRTMAHLFRCFRAAHGMSPRQYRLRERRLRLQDKRH